MSRIGKKPIAISEKTAVTLGDGNITVKGVKGSLSSIIHPAIDVKIEDNNIIVSPLVDTKKNRALQGVTRAIINNMVIGTEKGFERSLVINGIGYRAELKGKKIIFNLGYSHPVEFPLPEGITADIDRVNLKLMGIDKQKLGLVAAAIRMLRPPEPYKGKGIKYFEEHIQRKAGKTGTK